jgi:carboxyl-terminal processing protease
MTVLQSLLSWSIISSTGSNTKVLYIWIRKNTPEHTLLQQAIDSHIISNQKLLFPLKSEFTRDSVRKFALSLFWIKLDIYGDIAVDEETQAEIMTQFQQTADNNIRKYILNSLITDHNGILITGTQTDSLLKQLNDPYSRHLSGKDNRIFQQIIDGTISGIWVSLSKQDTPYISIVQVFEDSPAMEQGLQSNDRITKIDDHSISKDEELSDIIELIQWREDTSVTLTIQRGDTIFTKTITRKIISIDPIELHPLSSGAILMTISNFQVNIYNNFLKKIPTLKQYNNIIIDLRNNGWGSLEDTYKMLNHIVPKRRPIYYVVTDTNKKSILSQWSDNATSLQNKKIIFLTNEYTASAAEIFAGVTKEYNTNSIIVGWQSFGKWSIQTVRNYADGTTLKITTAHRLLWKSKKSIQGKGLTPDYIISDDPLTIEDEVIEYIMGKI